MNRTIRPALKNRTLRLTALTVASILTLMPLASAQTGTAQTATPTANAAQRSAAPQPGSMRPGRSASFTLVRQVAALNGLGRTPGTALSSEQAKRLAGLLSPLKTAKTLTTAQANSLSASIDRLLTPAQRSALAHDGGRQDGGRMQGQPGQRPPGQAGQPGDRAGAGQPGSQGQPDGQRPPAGQDGTGQAAGRGGPMQNGMAPDSNPFLNGHGSQILSDLLGQLQK